MGVRANPGIQSLDGLEDSSGEPTTVEVVEVTGFELVGVSLELELKVEMAELVLADMLVDTDFKEEDRVFLVWLLNTSNIPAGIDISDVEEWKVADVPVTLLVLVLVLVLPVVVVLLVVCDVDFASVEISKLPNDSISIEMLVVLVWLVIIALVEGVDVEVVSLVMDVVMEVDLSDELVNESSKPGSGISISSAMRGATASRFLLCWYGDTTFKSGKT